MSHRRSLLWQISPWRPCGHRMRHERGLIEGCDSSKGAASQRMTILVDQDSTDRIGDLYQCLAGRSLAGSGACDGDFACVARMRAAEGNEHSGVWLAKTEER